MTTRDALFAAVCAAPNDDLPRLVFADWLDEQGESLFAEYIRLQIATETEGARPEWTDRQLELIREPLLLLDPIDRELFEAMYCGPMFDRGFICGVAYPTFRPQGYDRPICPAEEVSDDWHLVCDLMVRNALVNAVVCPDWFAILLTRQKWDWMAEIELDRATVCVTCGGLGMAVGNTDCSVCDGAGTATRFEWTSRERVRLTDSILRHTTSRLLFGEDRPLIRDEK